MINHINTPTPWGRSQGGENLMEGIIFYHTSGHGGAKALAKHNKVIPLCFRNREGWYEEDCDVSILWYFFYEEIKAYMTKHNMPGYGGSAEEYFSKFTKEHYMGVLERWYPHACTHYFKTVFTPERINELGGADRFAAKLEMLVRKDTQPKIKAGDAIAFDVDVEFTGFGKWRHFDFVRLNIFKTPCGKLVRISNWKDREYTIIPHKQGAK